MQRADMTCETGEAERRRGQDFNVVTKLIEDINTAVDNAKPAQKKPQTPAKLQAKTVKK